MSGIMVYLRTAYDRSFLNLIYSSPTSFYVSTLDIDLVWQTHQLKGEMYHEDCMNYIRRYTDQHLLFDLIRDGPIDQDRLAAAFRETCEAWEEQFHLPYTWCNCPRPGEVYPRRRKRSRSKSTSYARIWVGLIPPGRPDVLAATHASGHNGVHLRIQCVEDTEALQWAKEAKLRDACVRKDHAERKRKTWPGKELDHLEDVGEWTELTNHILQFA